MRLTQRFKTATLLGLLLCGLAPAPAQQPSAAQETTTATPAASSGQNTISMQEQSATPSEHPAALPNPLLKNQAGKASSVLSLSKLVPSRTVITDEVVAMVGTVPILFSELTAATMMLESERAKSGTLDARPARDEALEWLLVQRLMLAQARLDSLDQNLYDITPQIEHNTAQLINQYGSTQALEKAIGKPLHQIKKDMKMRAEEEQLSKMMQGNIMRDVKVSNNEVRDFFMTIPTDSLPPIPVQYRYSQLVRMPPATEERKYEIRQQLLEYRGRILAGERFSTLARLYSMDQRSAARGGEDDPIEIEGLVQPFAEALETMKPGQVSEIVETEYGYHLIELISLENGIARYRHILLKPEFTVEEGEREYKLLDSLRSVIGSDRNVFDVAVMLYSMDPYTRQNGGRAYNREMALAYGGDAKYASTLFRKEFLEPAEFSALSALKVGEISSPYMTYDSKANLIYKIVRLDEIVPAHAPNLSLDFEMIQEAAMQNKQMEEFDRWINRTIRKIYIYISPDYANAQFERNWFQNSPPEQSPAPGSGTETARTTVDTSGN